MNPFMRRLTLYLDASPNERLWMVEALTEHTDAAWRANLVHFLQMEVSRQGTVGSFIDQRAHSFGARMAVVRQMKTFASMLTADGQVQALLRDDEPAESDEDEPAETPGE